MERGDALISFEELDEQFKDLERRCDDLGSTLEELKTLIQTTDDVIEKQRDSMTPRLDVMLEDMTTLKVSHSALTDRLFDAEKRAHDNSEYYFHKRLETDILKLVASGNSRTQMVFLYIREFFNILLDAVNEDKSDGTSPIKSIRLLWLRESNCPELRCLRSEITRKLGFDEERLNHLKECQNVYENLGLPDKFEHEEFHFNETDALELLNELKETSAENSTDVNETFRLVIAFVCVRKRPEFLASLTKCQQNVLVETLFGSDPNFQTFIETNGDEDDSKTPEGDYAMTLDVDVTTGTLTEAVGLTTTDKDMSDREKCTQDVRETHELVETMENIALGDEYMKE